MVFRMLLVYFRSEQFYSIMNPLSIETLVGHLKGVYKEQLEIDLLDIHNYSELTMLYNTMEEQEYNIVGFSIMSYTSDIFLKSIQSVDFKNAFIVLGNQLATYSSKFLLTKAVEKSSIMYDRIISIKGEGEIVLELIVRKMMESKVKYSLDDIGIIPNIVYMTNNKNCIETKLEKPDLSLMKYPPEYMYKRNPFIQMQLSRGCYWGKCSFCTRKSFRMGSGWESFPLERIQSDLQTVICNTNAKVIEFCDDEFFGGNSDKHLQRSYEIMEMIDKICDESKKKIKFRIFTRPDFIYSPGDELKNSKVRALLERLKQSGLSRIYIGIESGAETQLKRYNRGVSKQIIQKALEVLDTLKIKYDGGYIMFDKSLTLDEMIETINFYKKINLIESNQWIWRPMIANLGSKIGEELWKLEGNDEKVNFDTMEIKYEYDNKIIHYIQKIIDIKSAETRELFYALKVISKEDYDYTNKYSFNSIAHNFVKENGLIYVDFLYDFVRLIKQIDKEVLQLVDQCQNECNKGVFTENDTKTLRHFINQIKNVTKEDS